jgi:hypothetical protein
MSDVELAYFAYGSNMSRAIFYERRGMRPLAARPARLDGYRLCFNLPIGPGERGCANLEPEDGASTYGVLYRLTPTDFDRLDRTEGVHVGIYHRIPVDVMVADEIVGALTYRSFRISAGRKPSARYLGLLLDGAREHGLPEEHVRFLSGFELAVDER